MTNQKTFDIIVCVTGKYPRANAAMAQLVEHILGKDEVPSSNLGSSSRKPLGITLGALVFYRLYICLHSFTARGMRVILNGEHAIKSVFDG